MGKNICQINQSWEQICNYALRTVQNCWPAVVEGCTELWESCLTLILLTWTKWWAPASDSKWRMGFNLAFKGLFGVSM
jgi:hypothetical protein